jgi:hypothetical protein
MKSLSLRAAIRAGTADFAAGPILPRALAARLRTSISPSFSASVRAGTGLAFRTDVLLQGNCRVLASFQLVAVKALEPDFQELPLVGRLGRRECSVHGEEEKDRQPAEPLSCAHGAFR